MRCHVAVLLVLYGAATLAAQFAPIHPDRPSLATALGEQLGLRLQSAREPVDVLVVDAADHPSLD